MREFASATLRDPTMNRAAFTVCVIGFLLLPPVLLLARLRRPERAPWGLLAVLLLAGGWALVNGSVYFHYEALGDSLARQASPSQELLDRWAADGAKRVFALFFGWLYALVYSIPFLGVYALVARRRRAVR